MICHYAVIRLIASPLLDLKVFKISTGLPCSGSLLCRFHLLSLSGVPQQTARYDSLFSIGQSFTVN